LFSSFDAGDNEEEDPDDFVVYSRVPCDTLQKREKVTVGGGECVSNGSSLISVSSFYFLQTTGKYQKVKSDNILIHFHPEMIFVFRRFRN
jgi:hypothetical protein